ncbi:N-terminal Xaa-Pro-Lys N-methyltransferase 1, partial [Balamuthia mandrillaris]
RHAGDSGAEGAFVGEDGDGNQYKNQEELWEAISVAENTEGGKKLEWYPRAEKYWKETPATVDGVLGGFGFLSEIDITSSEAFLSAFFSSGLQRSAALDCGAGIGRITKDMLLKHFERVDLVEPNADFLNKAKELLSPCQSESHRVGEYFNSSLQEFAPQTAFYDVIWVQWVIGYLTDEHLVSFFKRCKAGLREGGILIVKDNLIRKRGFYVDTQDSSITRSDEYLKELFKQSNLELLKEEEQQDFPAGMMPVRTYALR